MKTKDQDPAPQSPETTEGAQGVEIDPSLLEEAKAQEAAAADVQQQIDATKGAEAASDTATKAPEAPDGQDGSDDEDDDEDFAIPSRSSGMAKYLGLGALAIALLVGLAFLGNRLMSPAASPSDGGAATAPAEPNSSVPDVPATTPAPAPIPSSVTVTVPALDRFDLTGCTRANLEITPQGTWVFRNCAQPVLPAGTNR